MSANWRTMKMNRSFYYPSWSLSFGFFVTCFFRSPAEPLVYCNWQLILYRFGGFKTVLQHCMQVSNHRGPHKRSPHKAENQRQNAILTANPHSKHPGFLRESPLGLGRTPAARLLWRAHSTNHFLHLVLFFACLSTKPRRAKRCVVWDFASKPSSPAQQASLTAVF